MAEDPAFNSIPSASPMPCSSSSISASDFLPKLRYFSSSCGVFCTRSPIVAIFASRRQLADRTDSSSSEIAPRYVDLSGGYTRVLRLSPRLGDGAQLALLALSRLPAPKAATAPAAKPESAPKPSAGPKKPQAEPAESEEKPKTFFEGIRNIWTRKKKGSAAA